MVTSPAARRAAGQEKLNLVTLLQDPKRIIYTSAGRMPWAMFLSSFGAKSHEFCTCLALNKKLLKINKSDLLIRAQNENQN